MFKKLKNWIILILFGGALFGVISLTPGDTQKIDDKVDELIIEQTACLSSNSKYCFKPKIKEKDLYYEVNTYMPPSGKPGYQIIIHKVEANGDIYIKSIGYGDEAVSRTWDWDLVPMDGLDGDYLRYKP